MDVTGALTQGRNIDFHCAETVVQVFSKLALLDAFKHIEVGRRHNTHIGFLYLRGPHLEEFSVFEYTQQTYLRGQRQFAHFIQEDGSAVGHFKIPATGLGGSGKGSFFVPKKFTVNGAFRDSTAVDGDVLGVLAVRKRMDDFGYGFFAHPTFTSDQDRDIGGRHLNGLFQGTVQLDVVPDQLKSLFYTLNTFHCSFIRSYHCGPWQYPGG